MKRLWSWMTDKWGWFAFWYLGGRERERTEKRIAMAAKGAARLAAVDYFKRKYGEMYWDHPDWSYEQALQTNLAFDEAFKVLR